MDANELKDAFERWMKSHRETCSGEGCNEPLGVLAWLAHCFGVRTKDVGQFRDYLAQYEATCVNCQHMRN